MGYPALCVMALSLLVTACAFPHRKVSPMPMPSYEEYLRVDDEPVIKQVKDAVEPQVVEAPKPAKIKKKKKKKAKTKTKTKTKKVKIQAGWPSGSPRFIPVDDSARYRGPQPFRFPEPFIFPWDIPAA